MNTEEVIKTIRLASAQLPLAEGASQKASEIKAVIFDSDGVLFPNLVEEGWGAFADSLSRAIERPILVPKPKVRSYYDGQGVSLLRAIGLSILVVTNEKDADAAAVTATVEKWNKLPSSKKVTGGGSWDHVTLRTGMGGPRKVVAAEEFVKEHNITLADCAFMCDDLVDLDLAKVVGFVAAPASAEWVIRDKADFVSRLEGGCGAVRDFANFILACRGIDPCSLPPQ